MIWPAITVMIITYKRPTEIRKTISALKEKIKYPGKIFWHIADDESGENYIPDIKKDFPELKISGTTCHRGGWGKNFNTAFREVATEYIFVCEDDYVAIREIDLQTGILLMKELPTTGLIRYDGIEGHKLNLFLRSVKSEETSETIQFAFIDRDSPDLYIYSNRPHLVSKAFHNKYGLYPEGISLGITEEAFAHIIKDRVEDEMDLAILSTGIPRAFDHIGHSYQLTTEDISK